MRTIVTIAVALAVGAGGSLAFAGSAKPPKAYLIAEVEVTNPESYKVYAAQAPAIVASYGGRYLARGGTVEQLEGAPPAGRFVIVEFPSLERARSFYRSPQYQAISPIRRAASRSRFFLTEGLPR